MLLFILGAFVPWISSSSSKRTDFLLLILLFSVSNFSGLSLPLYVVNTLINYFISIISSPSIILSDVTKSKNICKLSISLL